MKNRFVLIGVLLVLGFVFAGVATYIFLSDKSDTQQSGGVLSAEGEPAVTIIRTKNGYEPKEVTIKQGEIVRFSNESGDFHWPASDLHPTHGVYPEFDPLRPIADKEDWQFRFDQVGVWNFHDHIRANKTGTITVTE